MRALHSTATDMKYFFPSLNYVNNPKVIISLWKSLVKINGTYLFRKIAIIPWDSKTTWSYKSIRVHRAFYQLGHARFTLFVTSEMCSIFHSLKESVRSLIYNIKTLNDFNLRNEYWMPYNPHLHFNKLQGKLLTFFSS